MTRSLTVVKEGFEFRWFNKSRISNLPGQWFKVDKKAKQFKDLKSLDDTPESFDITVDNGNLVLCAKLVSVDRVSVEVPVSKVKSASGQSQ